VSLEHRDGVVLICVEDDGPGVPADEREQIFEPFVRGRGARHRGVHGGAGLGLSLVAEHVRAHHGHVWVEERTNGGARFVVELPVVT
jgi:signal transduction histidine kinase